jgi:signal transduction histidine kinase
VDAVAEDTREGRYVAVGVRDTGTGIAHAVVRRLGEAFTLNAILAGDHPVAGAGLGLAICRGIAAAHGGSISVETAPNRGTVVTVRLRADLDGPQAGARAQPIVVRELA